jgi:5S rRNA maturation endonuclease (ribonuclease M5)
VFQVVRRAPKDFRQRRPDGNGDWVWNMRGVELLPYNLPAVGNASEVFVCEGEKDCDNLAKIGIVATTNPGGADKEGEGGKKWPKVFARWFQGRHVVIIPDNDDAGRRHANAVARKLTDAAASIRILEPLGLPPKGDVSDWLEAGGTAEQLHELAMAAPAWKPGHDANGEAATGWLEPEPLPSGLAVVEPFPLDLLPAELRPWVEDAAERSQAPVDYLAVGAMVALGSLLGRQIAFRPKRYDDWTIAANLWGAVVGPPGVLKTPALEEALRHLRAMEVEAKQRHDEAAALWEARCEVEHECKKLRADTIKKRLKENQEPTEIARDLAADGGGDPPKPARQRFITNDSTVEKMGELLNQNPNGLLLFRDEIMGWLRGLEKEGSETARAFYLEALNGTGRFTSDRIGRGTIDIEAACVSILGGIQPGPLTSYLGQSGMGRCRG